MSIGSRLKEEREKIGYSQERLASIGGVKKGAQINYEAGKRQPDAAYLRGVAQVGIDLQYVLIGLPSANLIEAMLSDEFVEETNSERSIALHAAKSQVTDEQLLLLNFRRCKPESKELLLQTSALLSNGLAAQRESNQTINAPVGGHAAGGNVTISKVNKSKK